VLWQVLLRHAGRTPPAPGHAGTFALGAPGVLARVLVHRGLGGVVQRTVALPLQLPSAARALTMMHEEGLGGG